MKLLLKSWLMLVMSMCMLQAHAHQASISYLNITLASHSSSMRGEWQIALRDLDYALGIDGNADGLITWGELKQRREAIAGYAFARLKLEAIEGGIHTECAPELKDLLVDEHIGGRYAVLRFIAACPFKPTRIGIHYSLLFDLDPNHRGLVNVVADGSSQASVLSPDTSTITLNVQAVSRWQQWRKFVNEGVWHIWKGYDHILFLLTLLIPAVVQYRAKRWQARSSLRDAVIDVTKVVTAFTVAHSVSLALAVYGWVHLPSRWIESAIALTVLLGALNNLFPIVRERRWLVAFVFGSIHGLAFATVLTDLGLQGWNLFWSLIAFNMGVEVGQLAIVLVFVPVAYKLRTTTFYRRAFIPAGAVSISALAAYWFVARLAGV